MATTSLAYPARILIISPNRKAASDLKGVLTEVGVRVSVTADPQTAAELLYEQQPQFVLLTGLDNLHDISRWCRQIRSEPAGRSASLLLIAPGEELAQIDFAWGVDDYLPEPWASDRLLLRLRIMQWRREKVDAAGALAIGDLVINLRTYEVSVRDRPVALTLKEYALLSYLARNQRQVCTREAILDAVWGADYYGGGRTVDVHMRRLRAKMPEVAEHLQTVRNVGYRLQA